MTRSSQLQTAYNSGELSPLLHGRVDYQRFQTGLAVCRGFLPLRQGGATRAPGTLRDGETDGNAAARLVSFEFAADDSLILELTPGTMRFWRYGRLVTVGGTPYAIAHPYDAEEIARLQWVQSADVIYLAEGTKPIHRLARRSLTDWSIAPLVTTDGPFRIPNVDTEKTIRARADVQLDVFTPTSPTRLVPDATVELTASWDFFGPAMIGTLLQLEPFQYDEVPLWTSSTKVAVGDVMRANGNIYQLVALTGEDTGAVAPSHAEGVELVDAQAGAKWRFLSDARGVARITEVEGPRVAKAVVVRTIPLPVAQAPTYRWAEAAWSETAGYPAALDLYDQRLVAASTRLQPRTLWFSTIGSFTEFAAATGTEADADAAFAYTVSGTESLNRIAWLKAGKRGLHVGALGEVFSARSLASDQAIGPTTFALDPDGSIGVHRSRPIAPDGRPIFIAKDRRRVYESRYDLQEDGNRPVELSLPAEHLGQVRFEEIVWQDGQQRMAWLRMGDGTLSAMLHDPQEDVLGWAPCPVAGGHVVSLATYSDPETTQDVLILCVRREIGGRAVHTVERQSEIFGLTAEPAYLADHLYCARRFAPEAPTAAFAVPHLAGAEVHAWTDLGHVGPIAVPFSGTVTLPYPVSHALIGLQDDSHEMRTLPARPLARDGDTQGRLVQFDKGHGARVHRTAAGRVQTYARRLDRDEQLGAAINLVPERVLDNGQVLHSGITEMQVGTAPSHEIGFRFTPVGGAPMTLLSITTMGREAGG